MSNGKCRLHGGKSSGPRHSSKHAIVTARKHGIYSKFFSDEEQELEVQVGSLENELEMARVMLRRAIKAKAEWTENLEKGDDIIESTLELHEIHRTEGTQTKIVGDQVSEVPVSTVAKVRRRPDFEALIQKWTLIVDRLEKTHKELQGGAGTGSPEDRARAIHEAVDEMDSSVPSSEDGIAADNTNDPPDQD